jgi:hypothetical protein
MAVQVDLYEGDLASGTPSLVASTVQTVNTLGYPERQQPIATIFVFANPAPINGGSTYRFE